MEKTIRCTMCGEEFTDEEIENANCCPKCGSKGVPMSIRHDVTVRINWHELRILGIWASNWAEKCGEDAPKVLEAILGRLDKYRPEGAAALTLMEEVKELQDHFPSATLFKDGKMVMPPKEEGHA